MSWPAAKAAILSFRNAVRDVALYRAGVAGQLAAMQSWPTPEQQAPFQHAGPGGIYELIGFDPSAEYAAELMDQDADIARWEDDGGPSVLSILCEPRR